MKLCEACDALTGAPAETPKHAKLVKSGEVRDSKTDEVEADFFNCSDCGRRMVRMVGGKWQPYESHGPVGEAG